MIAERFPEIQSLTKQERVLLYCELRDLVVQENELLTPDTEIVAELERRMEEYRRNPGEAKTWEEVRERLRAGLRPTRCA